MRIATAGERKGNSTKGRRAFRPGVGELEPRLVMATGAGLSPPWVTFHDELAATVGRTPGVVVSPLIQIDSGNYIVAVSTRNAARGVALATVLDGSHDFGGVNVAVVATDLKANLYGSRIISGPSQLAAIEQTALAGNPMFRTVVTHPIFPGLPDTVFPVFTRSVVQFPNDNLADAFQNFNAVAASAFGDALAGQVVGIDVDPSTASAQRTTTTSTGATLSPPWVTFHDELAATVGKTPGVVVSPLIQIDSGNYIVAVSTRNTARGVALATVLDGSHDFGGVNVAVVATDLRANLYSAAILSSSTQVANLERTALAGNPLFRSVVTHPIFPGEPDTVFPVFTRTVVQFPNDNLADAFQNFNAVTADAFGDVLDPEPGGIDVAPSTARS